MSIIESVWLNSVFFPDKKMAMCYLCIRNLLFDTSKTQKNKCMVLKYRWSQIYRLHYTWMPSVYKTKSKWPDKGILPLQKTSNYKNWLHTITFLLVSLEPLMVLPQKNFINNRPWPNNYLLKNRRIWSSLFWSIKHQRL